MYNLYNLYNSRHPKNQISRFPSECDFTRFSVHINKSDTQLSLYWCARPASGKAGEFSSRSYVGGFHVDQVYLSFFICNNQIIWARRMHCSRNPEALRDEVQLCVKFRDVAARVISQSTFESV